MCLKVFNLRRSVGKLLVLLLSLELVLHHHSDVRLDCVGHFLLGVHELFRSDVQFFGLLNDVFLLRSELIVNLTLFTLLLQ